MRTTSPFIVVRFRSDLYEYLGPALGRITQDLVYARKDCVKHARSQFSGVRVLAAGVKRRDDRYDSFAAPRCDFHSVPEAPWRRFDREPGVLERAYGGFCADCT